MILYFSFRKIFLLLVIISFLTSSCKIVKSIYEISKKETTIHKYEYGDKKIVFCGIHHLGRRSYYKDLLETVQDHKKNGYVVYYELVSRKFESDSISKDRIYRKLRKLVGTTKNYSEQAKEVPILRKLIQQPKYSELGITETDVNADCNYKQIIDEFEKLYGTIELDSIDINTELKDKTYEGEKTDQDKWNKVFIQFRNDQLLSKIYSKDDKRILILYGEGHRKDFKKKLKFAHKKKSKLG